MYFNILNGGDFDQLQGFMHTFMRPTCPFETKTISLEGPSVPSTLQGVGPRMHVHYFLGNFVVCPDLVFVMGNSQVVTSNAWLGSKLVIPFEFKGSYTYSIPQECWIPPADKVDSMYSEPSIERMLAALKLQDSSDTIDALPEHEALRQKVAAIPKKRKRSSASVPCSAPQLVPKSYLQALQEGATLLEVPQTMHCRGLYVISLDENHHMRSISLSVMNY